MSVAILNPTKHIRNLTLHLKPVTYALTRTCIEPYNDISRQYNLVSTAGSQLQRSIRNQTWFAKGIHKPMQTWLQLHL